MTATPDEPGAPFFSVVVPVYNSEQTLTELHQRLTTVLEDLRRPYELIFVEDCGRDGSWQRLRDLATRDRRITAMQLMRNSGQGNATLAGLQAAAGQVIITLDDDLQHPPEELPAMIHALLTDFDLDAVIGAPLVKRHSLVRRLGSRLINQVNSLMLSKDPNLVLTGFRVMRRQVVDAILDLRVPYPAIGLMLISVTRRITNQTVRHDPRKVGKSNYHLRPLIKQTLSNFIGYSVLPLHLLAAVGATGILISAFIALFYLARYLLVGIGVAGWTTLLLVLLALSGFNFFAFAILGEYLLKMTQIASHTAGWIIRSKVSQGEDAPAREDLARVETGKP